MTRKDKPELIKKTIVLHPIMDNYVRRTWAILIEGGYDATYSSALNMMLLMAIMETQRQDGLSGKTLDTIWDFARDQKTIDRLNLEDHVAELREYYKIGGKEK